MSKKKVLLGMSGGVDSSVAALLLLKAGYDATGMTMRLRPDAYMQQSASGGCCSLDDIDDAARVSAFGVLKEGEPDSETYSETGDPTPYGGLGYIRVRKRKGVTSYVAYWVHKCQIAINTDSANTKGSTITWQTPTVDGTIMAAYPNADKKARFRDYASFATEADAYSWINEKAGIA